MSTHYMLMHAFPGVYAIWPYGSDEPVEDPQELLDRHSMIDRGPAPSHGSGPVFICHLTEKAAEKTISIGGRDVAVNHITAFGAPFNFEWGSKAGLGMYTQTIRYGKAYPMFVAVQYDTDTQRTSQTLAAYATTPIVDLARNPGSYWRISARGGGSYYVRTPAELLYDPYGVLEWLAEVGGTWTWDEADFYLRPSNYMPGTDVIDNDFTHYPFKFGEHAYFSGMSNDLPGSGRGLHPGLFSAAYYAAQDKLPQLLSNTFQNLLEVGQTALSLANGIDLSDLRRLRNLAGDAWLAYRYQYNTTVSDLEELESTLERFDDLSRVAGNITSYGMASDSTGSYHCALVVDSKEILSRSVAKRFNLRPTLANAWDMIPYSFIVDWFTNIGEVLGAIDRWLDSPSFGSVTCWYSYTNSYDTDLGRLTCYFRYSAGKPLLPYWSMDYSKSSRVWAWRAADTVSLLL